MTTNLRPRYRWILLLPIVMIASACGFDNDDSGARSFTEFGAGDAADDTTESAADFEIGAPDALAAPSTTVFAVAQDDSAAPDDRPADAPEEALARDAQEGEDGALAVPTGLTAADIGRDIVYRASVDVEVDDVAAAGEEASLVIRALGGIIFGQATTTEPTPRSVLTFKVLPEDFDDALADLAGIGELVNQTISADDVTERVVDLESRIFTSEASVIRLRSLLDDADDLAIIATVESQLLDRETTLETLRGQLRTLTDQVSLATITLTITERVAETLDAAMVVVAWLGDNEDDACPGNSDLTIGANDTVVLCLEIDNTGDATLTEIDIEVPSFRLRVDDFMIRDGSVDSLEPGDTLQAVVELQAEDGLVRRRDVSRGVGFGIIITAVPADNVDTEVEAFTDVFLMVESDDSLPSFADSFSGGVDTLAVIWSIVLIVVGSVLPFLPFILLLAWFARRQARKRPAGPSEPDTDADAESAEAQAGGAETEAEAQPVD